MTISEWANSDWPYIYMIGIIMVLSIMWVLERHQQQKKDAKRRHPSNRFRNR